jgi:hypothetical protein
MNSNRFIEEQERFISGSYEQFLVFGGPCVYFHNECLKAQRQDFLSLRHIEMLYATLTAWGMHRMGDSETTKTKLTDWPVFSDSFFRNSQVLKQYLPLKLKDMDYNSYISAIESLKPIYFDLKLSVSEATIVVNSKALHHLFPELIPPIDRQYTIRFFRQLPEKWFDARHKFRLISLPQDIEEQFLLFKETCGKIKELADRIRSDLIESQCEQDRVPLPKLVDNGIVNYIRLVSGRISDVQLGGGTQSAR